MASLTIPNIFTAGTPALASEVNANFTAVVNWSTGLDQDNMATFTGDLAFTIANGNAIVIQNNGNDESIKITQGALLGAGKASILITDNQTQVASGAAELKMVLAAGATIPAIHITHGVDTFKLTKDYLRLEAILKPPVKTTVQRNAISSPEEGSVIYNSTTAQLNEKRNDGWAPVGSPVGSVQMFAGSSAPEGWLLCDGSTLDSIANPKYAALFAVINTTYGGTGASSFKVPDCRGIFVKGAGTNTTTKKSTYTFTIASSSVTAGAVYSNNTQTFTVLTTISSSTTLVASGTGAPQVSGTLTKVSGTGPATIAYSAYVQYEYSGVLGNSEQDTTAKNGLYLTDPMHSHAQSYVTSGGITGWAWNQVSANTVSQAGAFGTGFSSTGITLSSYDFETKPANIALNYIIKY